MKEDRAASVSLEELPLHLHLGCISWRLAQTHWPPDRHSSGITVNSRTSTGPFGLPCAETLFVLPHSTLWMATASPTYKLCVTSLSLLNTDWYLGTCLKRIAFWNVGRFFKKRRGGHKTFKTLEWNIVELAWEILVVVHILGWLVNHLIRRGWKKISDAFKVRILDIT